MSALVLRGDARALPLPDASVDAVICDPPYEINFMGRGWDGSGVAFAPGTWVEALRVLKPGGHLLAFGGTRTYHRLTCAIEDAGFEIRDSIGVLGWVYASGFPKSLDVSRAIDAAAGAVREVTSRGAPTSSLFRHSGSGREQDARAYADGYVRTAPATADAARWQGWGTALKPAWEPIVVARKPLAGNVAANVLAYGTGAINVDGCRVQTDWATDPTRRGWQGRHLSHNSGTVQFVDHNKDLSQPDAAGRWPTNFVLVHHPDCADWCVSGCHVAELDAQSGVRTSGKMAAGTPRDNRNGWAGPMPAHTGGETYGDSGGASRFYPQFRFNPKADSAERPTLTRPDGTVLAHPTVKPVDLMRWLVRLVTPPGGIVLDPFAGSGATLQAASVEGFRAVGVEPDADHCALIRERLSWPVRIDRDGKFERLRPSTPPAGQIDMFAPADGGSR